MKNTAASGAVFHLLCWRHQASIACAWWWMSAGWWRCLALWRRWRQAWQGHALVPFYEDEVVEVGGNNFPSVCNGARYWTDMCSPHSCWAFGWDIQVLGDVCWSEVGAHGPAWPPPSWIGDATAIVNLCILFVRPWWIMLIKNAVCIILMHNFNLHFEKIEKKRNVLNLFQSSHPYIYAWGKVK
jgi:hypothetical protein